MQTIIRTIIVEDEPSNCENLQYLLKQYCPRIEIIATCSSAPEAHVKIMQLQPELVFLDIEMPGGNGFSLLESLAEINFEVIFVTAYDHYGIKAIKFCALDYLLKPIDIMELVKAVEKATEKIGQRQKNKRMEYLLQNTKRTDEHKMIALALADKIEFVEISSIIRCESESNYTTFFLKDGKKAIVSKTLKEYDELLTPYHFLRVHQSHLINLNEIKSFIKSDGGYIKMKDGSSVSISRQRREMVINILQNL